jgi:hypothetical protein
MIEINYVLVELEDGAWAFYTEISDETGKLWLQENIVDACLEAMDFYKKSVADLRGALLMRDNIISPYTPTSGDNMYSWLFHTWDNSILN